MMDYKKNIIGFGIGILIICIVFVGFFIYKFYNYQYSYNISDWGAFGDYIGGVLGFMVAVYSAILIYYTYKGQMKMSYRMQFEASFFALLESFRQIYKGLQQNSDQKNYCCVSDFNKQVRTISAKIYDCFFELSKSFKDEEIDVQKVIKEVEKYQGEWTNRQEWCAYFRNFYSLVLYIHTTSFLSLTEKKKYIDILHAQLHDHEMFILFWNILGRSDSERIILDQYEFFNDVNMLTDYKINHEYLYTPAGQCYDIVKKHFFPNTHFSYKEEVGFVYK